MLKLHCRRFIISACSGKNYFRCKESKNMIKIEERNNNEPFSQLTSAGINGNGQPCQNGEVLKATVLLESDTKALSHQIAGHSRTGVLKHKLGYVLKPFQKDPLGPREVDFYKRSYDNDSWNNEDRHHNLILQKYIPNFYGLMKILLPGEETGNNLVWKHFIALEDLVEGFSKPCIIDIKIGAQTWDPFAPPAKVAHEKSKYAGTKEPLGLSLTGMQHYDLNTHKTLKMEKELGKTLVKATFVDKLYEFLNGGHDPSIPKSIAKHLIPKLKEIQEYFQLQRDFRFYASSLLIGYDAEEFDPQNGKALKNGSGDYCEDVGKWLRVNMIDFAHVIPVTEDNPGPDSNYLFGLNNLIQIFEHYEHLNRGETHFSSSDSE